MPQTGPNRSTTPDARPRAPAASAPASAAVRDREDCAPRPSAQVTFHLAGDGALLFDARGQRIFSLDRPAAFLWCALAETSAAEAAGIYARHTGLDAVEAGAHLSAMVDRWAAMGLLATAAGEIPLPRHGRPSAAAPGAVPRRPDPRDGGRNQHRLTCRILDVEVAVTFGDRALAGACRPLIAAVLADATTDRAARRTAVSVVSSGTGARILAAGMPAFDVAKRRELAPAVLAVITRAALRYCTGFPAIHAAMVATPRGALLLPAPSGYGKSTLAAGLMAAGMRTLCDDTVVLDRETLEAAPVLPYLCLKSGSWRTTGGHLPGLWRSRAYRRPDGYDVRYVRTRPAAVLRRRPANATERVSAAVFARYCPGAPTACRRLSTAEAIDRLLPNLDPIGKDFTAADVDRLIAWIEGLPCYALRHASTADGVAAVREIAA